MELCVEQRRNIRLEEHIVTLETVVLAVYLLVSVPDPKPSPARCYLEAIYAPDEDDIYISTCTNTLNCD